MITPEERLLAEAIANQIFALRPVKKIIGCMVTVEMFIRRTICRHDYKTDAILNALAVELFKDEKKRSYLTCPKCGKTILRS